MWSAEVIDAAKPEDNQVTFTVRFTCTDLTAAKTDPTSFTLTSTAFPIMQSMKDFIASLNNNAPSDANVPFLLPTIGRDLLLSITQ